MQTKTPMGKLNEKSSMHKGRGRRGRVSQKYRVTEGCKKNADGVIGMGGVRGGRGALVGLWGGGGVCAEDADQGREFLFGDGGFVAYFEAAVVHRL